MKSPAFQLYVNDFLGSAKVGMMSAEEIGAFVLLLFLDWQEIGFVFEERSLSRWCRLSPGRFKKAWLALSPCFVERAGRMYNPRLEREREKQEAWREKSSHAGIKGAERRWAGHEPKASPNGNQPHKVAITKRSPNDDIPLPLPLPSPVTTKTTTGTASQLDRLPKADCDALFRQWCKLFGPIGYPTFRKKILLAYQVGAEVYALKDMLSAIEAAHEWFVEQDDREQSFFTLDRFISQLGSKWIAYGKMPRTVNGTMTERGAWAGTKAMREASRQSRAFA